MHLQIKKLNVDISTHSPSKNSPPGSAHYPHSPQGKGNNLFSAGSAISKIFFHDQQKGEGGKNYGLLYQNSIRKSQVDLERYVIYFLYNLLVLFICLFVCFLLFF